MCQIVRLEGPQKLFFEVIKNTLNAFSSFFCKEGSFVKGFI
jgi:hypothetical protein